MYGLTPFDRKSFDLFNAFHDFEKDFFGTGMTTFKTDIRDDGDKYVMEAELPGFEKGDIRLDITGDSLVLTAEHSENKVDKDKEDNYICRERSYGSYQRSFDISSVDADKIEAEYKNGILYMVMPKKEPQQPQTRRLEVK